MRELYGVQNAMKAQHATFVALGTYTPDAHAFPRRADWCDTDRR